MCIRDRPDKRRRDGCAQHLKAIAALEKSLSQASVDERISIDDKEPLEHGEAHGQAAGQGQGPAERVGERRQHTAAWFHRRGGWLAQLTLMRGFHTIRTV